MTPPLQLQFYQQLYDLHVQMETLALRQDWPTVVRLQEEADGLITRIKAAPSLPPRGPLAQSQAALIKAILGKQITIKKEISDWQDDVRPLLASLGRADKAP